jgi:hypothetical protein
MSDDNTVATVDNESTNTTASTQSTDPTPESDEHTPLSSSQLIIVIQTLAAVAASTKQYKQRSAAHQEVVRQVNANNDFIITTQTVRDCVKLAAAHVEDIDTQRALYDKELQKYNDAVQVALQTTRRKGTRSFSKQMTSIHSQVVPPDPPEDDILEPHYRSALAAAEQLTEKRNALPVVVGKKRQRASESNVSTTTAQTQTQETPSAAQTAVDNAKMTVRQARGAAANLQRTELTGITESSTATNDAIAKALTQIADASMIAARAQAAFFAQLTANRQNNTENDD